MHYKERLTLLTAIAANISLASCTSLNSTVGGGPGGRLGDLTSLVFDAEHIPHELNITDRLTDSIWADATAYPLAGMKNAEGHRAVVQEPGAARFAWDVHSLYLAVDFTDSDVVTDADKDGLLAYTLGDVCELFLRPEGQSCYWEFYVTPNGHQTTLFWPSGGRRLLPSALQTTNRLIVGTRVRGTLNDYRDRDQGWTGQIAVPWEMLKFNGLQFGPQTQWRVLVGRYNYSVHLPTVELSSAPALSSPDYHLINEYASLRLIGNAQE